MRVSTALAPSSGKTPRPPPNLEPPSSAEASPRLLDEQGAAGVFPSPRRQRRAIARCVDAVTCSHGGAEEIGVGALPQLGLDQVVAVLGAGIGHDANTAGHTLLVEKRGHHDGEAPLRGAGPAPPLPPPIP